MINNSKDLGIEEEGDVVDPGYENPGVINFVKKLAGNTRVQIGAGVVGIGVGLAMKPPEVHAEIHSGLNTGNAANNYQREAAEYGRNAAIIGKEIKKVKKELAASAKERTKMKEEVIKNISKRYIKAYANKGYTVSMEAVRPLAEKFCQENYE